MQDNERHSSIDYSASNADIVRVNSTSIAPQDDFSESGSVQPFTPGDQPSWGIIQRAKNHVQLLFGIALGAIATLFLGQFNTSSDSPIPFQKLALNQTPALQNDPLAQVNVSSEVLAPPAPPGPVEASPQFSSQLQFVDRFYFTQAPAPGQHSPPAWFMVDRFYLGSAANQQSGSGLGPAAAALPVDWPQVPWQQHNAAPPAGRELPQNVAFQGVLEVPPPPAPLPLPGSQPLPLSQGNAQGASPSQGPHTLLGVVKTNSFGAALINTNGSSYSVKVGEMIQSSGYRLTGLEHDQAILSRGPHTRIIQVGERF